MQKSEYSEQFDKERKYRLKFRSLNTVQPVIISQAEELMRLQRLKGALMPSRRMATQNILWMLQII